MTQAGLKFDAKRVASRSAFIKELEEFSPDLILADYSLPGFGGQAALKIVVDKFVDIPFIFVSGAFGANWRKNC